MEREVDRGRMQPFDYHKRKADMMESLAFGIDDGKTKTSGKNAVTVQLRLYFLDLCCSGQTCLKVSILLNV